MEKTRKIFALLLCILLCLSAVGCAKKDSETGNGKAPADGQDAHTDTDAERSEDSSSVGTDADFLERAPKDYEYAISVSINPEFVLYLKGREVFAYEALNSDAEKVAVRCAIVGRGIEGVMEDIVRFSYEEGFLKDGRDVKITLVDAFATESNSNDILKEAENSALDTAKRCGISINPVVVIDDSITFAPPSQDPQNPGDDHPEDPNRPGEDNPEDPNRPGEDTNEYHEPRKEEGCSVCRGTGICDRCDGSGVMSCGQCHATGYETCTKCMGAGYAGSDENGPVPCDQCAGKGSVSCNLCAGTKIEPCNGCAGSGKCSACGGTGRKPD